MSKKPDLDLQTILRQEIHQAQTHMGGELAHSRQESHGILSW